MLRKNREPDKDRGKEQDPRKEPLRLPRMTPIKLLQTYIDVPTYGEISRDPTSSYTITIAPEIKTMHSNMYFFISIFLEKEVYQY